MSNDVCNELSPVVEVIYLTSRKKNPLPTHVKVTADMQSTALCEQITSVDKERIEEYVGRTSSEEMEQINEALKISLWIGGIGEAMGEVITIDGIGIQIREYAGQHVLTLRDIDVIHKRTAGTAGRYFNQNKTRFREKKDFYLIKNEKNLSAEKVFTKSGYELLTRCYLATEKDIKVKKEVIDTYYTVKAETPEDSIGTTTMEAQNGLMVFENKAMGIRLRTILNDDGSISVSAEDTAIGFGWTTVATSGNEVVRWSRLNGFCEELGFPNKLGKDDYIPESLYYLLGMKANNERAQKFQRWLALDVIPQIRKTGSYRAEPEKLEVFPKVGDPDSQPQKSSGYEPGVYLEAARIIAQLSESRENVLNCLRHVVPDIDADMQPVPPIHETVEVKTELTTKQTETLKIKQIQKQNSNPKFFKVGVPCDVAKLKKTMDRKNISEYRMALLSEVSITTVKNILAEKNRPTIETRTKFCRALQVSDDYLTPTN